jgi:HEAT repeats
LAIGVDLMLGARLAGEVRAEFQERSVNLINECPTLETLKINLLELTKSEAAVQPLLKILKNSETDFSQSIALALYKTGQSQVILNIGEKLSKHLDEHLERVRFYESFADMMESNSPLRELNELFEKIQLVEYYSLEVCASEEIWRPTLSETLTIVGKVLNELYTPKKIIENVLTLLENPYAEARASAARILGMLQATQTVERLILALGDSTSQVREAVAEALGKLDDKRATNSLLRVLKEDAEDDVRYAALYSIGELGESKKISEFWDSFYKTENWQYISTIANIQSRCKFYNYEIFQAGEAIALIPAIGSDQVILARIDQTTKQMSKDPKVDKSVHISNSKNVKNINTGDRNTQPNIPENQSGFDWKFWLTIALTVIIGIASVSASGVFNDEIKQWFIKPEPSPEVDQKLNTQINQSAN